MDVLYKCQLCFDHDPLPRGFLTDHGPARSESSRLTLQQGKHRPVRQTFLSARWQTPTGRIVQRGPVVRPARRAAVPPPAKADSRKSPHVHPSPQRKQGKCRWPHTTQRGSHVRSTRWWRGKLLDVRRRRGRELGEFDLRGHGHTALRLLDPREVAGEESGMKLVHAPQAVGPASNQRHPRVDLE